MCAGNLDQLYSSLNHHRTTTNLSDIVWCMSGGVLSMSGGVWSMSGSVNVYRLIRPELMYMGGYSFQCK